MPPVQQARYLLLLIPLAMVAALLAFARATSSLLNSLPLKHVTFIGLDSPLNVTASHLCRDAFGLCRLTSILAHYVSDNFEITQKDLLLLNMFHFLLLKIRNKSEAFFINRL